MKDPSGVYEVGGTPFHIIPRADTWVVEFPGVPVGFEPGLSRIGDAEFRIERGPYDGAVLSLHDDRPAIGPLPVQSIEGPYVEPVGHGLLAPDLEDDPERNRHFQHLLDTTPVGGRIDWDGPYARHAFVQWATQHDRFIFHGSNQDAIEEFRPVRTSVELMDHGERGNLGAVYGTHDGLWSMFFAVVDRDRLRGSIRNGVSRWQAPDGRTIDTYQFSIHHECLPDHPFTDGAVYLLPRATFTRLPYYPDGPPSDEWASRQPVRPVARLDVGPGDFPFLDRIAGHDDGPLLEMMALARRLLEGATSLRREDEGISVVLAWSAGADSTYVAWRTALERFMPGVHVSLERGHGRRVLRISGPDAYERTIEDFVGGVLARRDDASAPLEDGP